MNPINRAIGEHLATFLTKSQPGYQRIDTVTIDRVAASMRTGDILLIEGNSRISTAIKYLTQSSWSHACLYIGAPGGGGDDFNLIEADLKEGVRLINLNHFAKFNLRICRPVDLTEADTRSLVDFAKTKIGHKYDLRNVLDLIRFVIQKPAVPNRYRRSMLSLGSGEPTRAICSTLIAEAYQSINYPILPSRDGDTGKDGEVPQFYKRHFTHFTPRDFDLSPYFRIVKPTIESGFNYQDLRWQDPPGF